MPTALAAAAFAAAAARRKPQAASRKPHRGRQSASQAGEPHNLKAESLVREIDCPVDQQARHPPIGHRKGKSQHPVAWQARAYALEPTRPVTSAH